MTGSTCVRDNNGDVTQIRTMPDGRLNPDLGCHANDYKCVDPAVAQSDVQGRAFKGRHRDLVDDGL
jgi:hypothetical protein